MRHLHSRCLPLLALAVLSMSSACASATPQDKTGLIRIEVTPEGGTPIKSLVEDGQSLRIEEKTGRALAFRPDIHGRPVKMRVFEILKNADGTETGERPLDETELVIGAASPKPVAKNYRVRILEVIAKK